MSATIKSQIEALFGGTESTVQVLTETEDAVVDYDLGEDHRLEVGGNASRSAHPFTFTLRGPSGTNEDSVLTVFEPPVAIFDAEAVQERYAGLVESLVDADAATTFREVVEEFGESYRNGEVLVLDRTAERLVKSTERVTFNPDSELTHVTIFLNTEHVRGGDRGMEKIEIKREDWGDTKRPTVKLPTGFGQLHPKKNPHRWRQLRLLWTLMYARDATVELAEDEDEAN